METSGLNQSEGHRIIEVAAIQVEIVGDKLVPRAKFVQRINPQRSIDPDAQAVHGIDISELTGMPTWDVVAPTLMPMLSSSQILIAHNLDFDGPFLGGELLRIGITPPTCQTFCTMANARWATATGKFPKLQELCFAVGIPYDEALAHGALYDVTVMLQALKRGLQRGFYTLPTIGAHS